METTNTKTLKINRTKIAVFNFLFNGIGTAINNILPIFFLPLMLKIIEKKQYGLWLIILELSSTGPLVRTIHHLFAQRIGFHHSTKKLSNLNDTFSLYLWFTFLTSILYFIFISLLNFLILLNNEDLYQNININFYDLIICSEITFLIGCIQIIAFTFHNTSICFQNPYYFQKILVVYRTCLTPITYIILIFTSSFYSFAIGYLISTFIYIIFLIRGIKNDFNFNQLKFNYNYNLLIKEFKNYIYAFFSALFNIIAYSPSWVISFLLNPKVTFCFKITQKLYEGIGNFLSLYIDSIGPGLSHYQAVTSNHKFKSKSLKIFFIFLIITFFSSIIIFYVNPIFVTTWIDKNTFLGKRYNFLLAIQMFLIVCSNGVNHLNRYIGNNAQSFKFSILESLILLFLSLSLTYFYSINGLIIGFIIVHLNSLIIYIRIFLNSFS